MIKDISCNFYQAEQEDTVINCYAIESDITIKLPSSVGRTKTLTLKKRDTTANDVYIINPVGDSIYDAIHQIETLTVLGIVTATGNAIIALSALEISNGYVEILVPVELDDTAEIVATKIEAALFNNAEIQGAYNIAVNGADVIMTQKFSNGNDDTINLSVDNDTCTGLTTVSYSSHTTAGEAITMTEAEEYVVLSPSAGTWIITERLKPTDFAQSPALTKYVLGTPIYTDDDYIVASADAKATAYTIAHQPDVPRNITVTVTANGTADDFGMVGMNVEGTNYDNVAIFETFSSGSGNPLIAGSTVAGLVAFKTITKIETAMWSTSQAADTIKVGVGNKIGMPVAFTDDTKFIMGTLGYVNVGMTVQVADGIMYNNLAMTSVDLSSGTYDGSKIAIAFIDNNIAV